MRRYAAGGHGGLLRREDVEGLLRSSEQRRYRCPQPRCTGDHPAAFRVAATARDKRDRVIRLPIDRSGYRSPSPRRRASSAARTDAVVPELAAGAGLAQGAALVVGQPRHDLDIQFRRPQAEQLVPDGLALLAEYLGHADPGFTLRTYTHLMPVQAGGHPPSRRCRIR
ncbi:MAG: hypothetical protein ACRDSF_25150 [Pseudonocardiaceae bacterium]